MSSKTAAPDNAGADTADMNIPPPLPPVLPPIMATATAAASSVAAVANNNNNNAIINANASFPEEEQQQQLVETPATNNTSSSVINFEGIMTELQNFQRENEGSLAIPSSHPVSFINLLCKNIPCIHYFDLTLAHPIIHTHINDAGSYANLRLINKVSIGTGGDTPVQRHDRMHGRLSL